VSDGLTHDGFLDGRVHAWQPRHGYRAATDPVFLAAACPAGPGDHVLELGCGVGVASLCLAARVQGVSLTGLERQSDYAALACRNADEAGVPVQIIEADLGDQPAEVARNHFHHVIANPPYYAAGAGTAARDPGREAALREDTPLPVWIACAKACLRPKGWLTLIQAADRLPDCLAALQQGFGSVAVRALSARTGRAAGRVLILARKGGRAPFRLLAPLVLHDGDRHHQDGDDYSQTARAILRDAAPLPWD